mmetsp:Transcript_13595/g.44421  ORF Transcript_13595/g.44421 Transcript_13595/m.44421 type:complete len:227 (-) Transcript_13595:554-1234(-)
MERGDQRGAAGGGARVGDSGEIEVGEHGGGGENAVGGGEGDAGLGRGLVEGEGQHGGHVEAVHGSRPKASGLFPQRLISVRCQPKPSTRGQHGAGGGEKPHVTGVQYRGEHPFVEKEGSHPFRDEQVHLLRQRYLLHPPADHFDHTRHPIVAHDSVGQYSHARRLDGVNHPRTQPCARERKHAAAAADVEHGLAVDQRRRRGLQRRQVGVRAPAAEHLLVDLSLAV